VAFDPTKPVHLAVRPFEAACGADVPNQQTTGFYAHVTCESCVQACGLVPVDEAELAAIEAGVKLSLPYQRQVPHPRTSAGVVFRLAQEVRRLKRGEFTPNEVDEIRRRLEESGGPGAVWTLADDLRAEQRRHDR
jgi:hypothetical protein